MCHSHSGEPARLAWSFQMEQGHVINYTSVYPVMTCQNGCCDSGVLLLQISDSPDMILLTSLSLAMFTVG